MKKSLLACLFVFLGTFSLSSCGMAGPIGPQGVQGEKGDKGESGAQGLKGDKGDKGDSGAQGLKGDKGDKGDSGAQGPKGDKGDKGDSGAQGPKGDKGEDGTDGRSVLSIEKTSSDGNVDTYTITYSDGSVSMFEVTNGTDGKQGIEGKPGKDGHTPTVTISQDGYWVIDGVKTGNSAVAQNGKSAYELYCEQHPEYKGSEEDWISDLESGKLRKITITFDTDGGTVIENITTTFGSYIQVSVPVKTGFEFVGWSLNGSMIDINTYVFFADCTLKAVWNDARYIKVTFDANGGVVAPSSFMVEYGKEYVLPEPSKKYQKFAGWCYGNTSIPTSGTWTYTHDDIELSALWTASNVYVDLEVDSEYGSVDTSRVTLQIGDEFTLPVPTSIKDGYTFNGWYDGDNKITGKDGKSLNVCEFQTTTLRASYYIEIATIYDFMKLGGQSLKGNYLITNDLDFKGMIVNSIGALGGTFDGGGHTLSNFALSSNASKDTYGGLFENIYTGARLLNIKLDNVSCTEEYSSGIVGYMKGGALIDNVSINNSFNDVEMRSILVGTVQGRNVQNCSLKNIRMNKSGNKCYSFGIYSSGYSEYSGYSPDYPKIIIDGFHVSDVNNTNKYSYGIIYELAEADSHLRFYEYAERYRDTEIKISRYIMDGNVANGVAPKVHYPVYYNIKVSSSEINGMTSSAWSGVTVLNDVRVGGKTKNWGCTIGTRCIDTANDLTLFENVNLKSSILLYPDANGVRSFYSSSGTRVTFNDPSIVNKDMFTSMLGFSEDVWNLDHIDVQNGIYPHVK